MPELTEEKLDRLRVNAAILCNGLNPDDPSFDRKGRPYVKPVNQGDKEKPYVAYTVRVADDQTLCIVPPFARTDGDRTSEATARAISTAGQDLFEAVSEIDRLRAENDRLQQYWNEAVLTLQSQVRLGKMLLDEHNALLAKYADPLNKMMTAAEALFDAPQD